MRSFKLEFYEFSLERINDSIMELKKNDNKYKEKELKYTKLTKDLFKNLSEDKVIIFDQIIDLLGDMSADECLATYRTAFNDAYKLQDKNYFFKEEVEE